MVRSRPGEPVCFEPAPRARRAAGAALAGLVLALGLVSSALAADGSPRPMQLRVSREFSRGQDPLDFLAGVQALGDEVAAEYVRQHGLGEVQVGFCPPLPDLASGFTDGSINIAYVTGFEFVQLRKRVAVTAIGTAVRASDRDTQTARVIVRRDNPASSIADLADRTFVFQSRSSDVGYLYPRSLLLGLGLPDIPRFFGKTVQVSKEKSAIYGVLLGEADTASVSSETLDLLGQLNPALVRKLRVLHESPPIPLGVLIVEPSHDQAWVDVIHESLLRDGLRPDVRAKLQILRLGRLKAIEENQFDAIQAMVDVLDRAEKRHLCPICGRRLTEAEVEATVQVASERVTFCSVECRDTYEEHCRRSRPGAEKPMLVLGVSRDMMLDGNPIDALALGYRLYEKVREAQDIDVAVEVVPSLHVARARLRAGTLGVVSLTGPGYVELKKSVDLVPIVRNETEGESFRVLLLVSEKSGIERFENLRGKSIALPSHEASPTRTYLGALLREQGRRWPEEYFGRLVNCSTEESAIRAVTFGQADATLIRSATYEVLRSLKPAVCRGLRILMSSDAFYTGPTAVRADLDEGLVARLRQVLLRIHETPDGRTLLQFYRTRRLVPASDEDYDVVRKMMEK